MFDLRAIRHMNRRKSRKPYRSPPLLRKRRLARRHDYRVGHCELDRCRRLYLRYKRLWAQATEARRRIELLDALHAGALESLLEVVMRTTKLKAAERAFVTACRAEEPKAIAAAWVRVALETPGFVEDVQRALRLLPYLERHGARLRKLTARARRRALRDAWRGLGIRSPNEASRRRLERFVLDAAMKALAEARS